MTPGTDIRECAQAAAEFVVSVFALLAAVIGVLTISALVRADSDAMDEARERAAAAIGENRSERSFPFVSEVRAGRDGVMLSPDDGREERGGDGTRSAVTRALLYGDGDGGGESVTSLLEEHGRGGGDRLAAFADADESGATVRAYALRKGEGRGAAILPPAAGALFGVPAELSTESETWMPATGGL